MKTTTVHFLKQTLSLSREIESMSSVPTDQLRSVERIIKQWQKPLKMPEGTYRNTSYNIKTLYKAFRVKFVTMFT